MKNLKSKLSRIGLVFLLFPGMIHLSGCYGSFPLTSAIYDINGEVTDNTVVHSVVMIVFAIFGVYGISMFLDALILNSVEFWSGDRMEISQKKMDDGSVIAFRPGDTDNKAIVTITKDDEVIEKRVMVRQDSGETFIYDHEGNHLSTVMPVTDSEFAFYNQEGRYLGTFSMEEWLSPQST